MGYCGGPTFTLDLGRPLEFKPSILLLDKQQMKMPIRGPRDDRGCTAMGAISPPGALLLLDEDTPTAPQQDAGLWPNWSPRWEICCKVWLSFSSS